MDDINYNCIDDNLNEREVTSNRDIIKLGSTFKDKMVSLRKICKNECGRDIPINNTKKVRAKWLRYIKEYEFLGHDEFVYNHTSRPYKSN